MTHKKESHIKKSTEVIKNKGVYSKRKCHDCLFLILFLAFWAGMAVVAHYGIKEGDPKRLLYGTDYEGNTCGVDNIAAGKLPANHSRDFTHEKYVYFIYYPSLASYRTICVSSCPNETYLTPDDPSQLICAYNTTPALNETFPQGTCMGSIASTPVLNRCVPSKITDATESIIDKLFQVISENFGDTSTKVFSDTVENWKYLIYGALIAMGLGLVYIFLLRFFAGLITWATVMGVIGCLALLCVQVYYQWQKAIDVYDSIPPNQRLPTQKDNVLALKVIFIILCVITGILALIILAMFSRIRLAIGIIKESSKAIGTMPSIFFFPVFIFVALCAFLAYWAVYCCVCYLGTAGTPTYDENDVFIGYEASKVLRYMQIYHFFGLLWTYAFILAINQCTLAGAIALWYWVMDKKDTPYFPVWKSFFRVIRYHLGSLAFGSLILAVVQFIRWILRFLEKKFKGKEAFLARFVIRCLNCLFGCFERFIKFIDKNAYIMVAIYGYSFCKGARRGFSLIVSNVLRVAAVSVISAFLIFLGRLLITVITIGISFILLQRIAEDGFYVVPVIIIGFIAFFISGGFMSVYDMAIDTMLLCFCEDSERNDGSPERPYFMSKSLKKFVDGGHTKCC
ncbi:solute carrier family 44 protein member 2 [Heterostelium album PN500]|uniref:Choline transporter-like protein n=1 Tax=Heterostelium pallidum (strain ATCC 26659 / Pp 5 / PN500) TaxID=670386 RepID=D3B8W9_HETP5|nr:solute carrier family 44 protein member 2 [Heterostelium album PN500]EFA82487.1 solute carrier family 44 protein member 2 [Heterostelium album PN500]|eukprot:XP_020434604.1 solute carrier family 44 protein member 2 [Heterostelium album PN500]